MSMSRLLVTGAGASLLLLAGCVSPDGELRRNTTGASAAGAVIGGVIGRSVSDDKTKGTLIGMAIGGAMGAAVGNEIDKQEEELRREMAGSGATIVNTGNSLVVTLPERVTFPTDSAAVLPRFVPSLGTLASNLLRYPANTVNIVGHTDNTGSDDYNLTLSERRANAVASILISQGVPASSIRTFGAGESQPTANNATASGRAENRRVEIVIIPPAA